jgi:hypothetical protein
MCPAPAHKTGLKVIGFVCQTPKCIVGTKAAQILLPRVVIETVAEFASGFHFYVILHAGHFLLLSQKMK